ncbi:MAG: excinuclease ABC subunit A [Planctomycetota bacterium]|nr:MAG: excinuclease ABC subunit A [Planctomycetota bacterium]
MKNDFIEVRGAKEHNLKNIDIKIPRDSFTVFTGVSGSGKSSLVYDTIFQEGQRRFTESLSAYARQFLGQMDKPQVEHIEGLSPTVSIDQKSVSRSRRSTVGTITEVYDFYRVLFARLGVPFCTECEMPVNSLTKDEIIEQIIKNHTGAKIVLMAPIVRHRKGEYRKELDELRKSGYQRVRIDKKMRTLDEKIELARYENHTIEIVLDRLIVRDKDLSRLSEGIEKTLELGKGLITTLIDNKEKVFSSILGCIDCGTVFQEIEPRLFSFNTPWGACEACNGLGETHEFLEELIIPDKSLSLNNGAIGCFGEYNRVPFSSYGIDDITILAKHYKIDMSKPWSKLSRKKKDIILFGSTEEIPIKWTYSRKGKKISSEEFRFMRGVIEVLERVRRRAPSPFFNKFIHRDKCNDCHGARLNKSARSVKIGNINIVELTNKTVSDSIDFLAKLKFIDSQSLIASPLLKEIFERLEFLNKVGLHYLKLNRDASSLSGGEAQRIRLARQVGSKLSGILYILDEPSIGLHQRDNKKLIETLKDLRDQNNTVLVIEHDEETMMAADYLVDVGPGAGVLGGEIVVAGTPFEVSKNKNSNTGLYLSGKYEISIPNKRRIPDTWIELKGATGNNLKKVNVKFPLKIFTAVTGVSGSGKSTLILETLEKILHRHVYQSKGLPAPYKSISGLDSIDKIVNIDQSPIGRTPRSNPATYTKVFDIVRILFASTAEAKVRGYKPGRFSFNVEGGRCEICKGNGEMEIEMQFLSNVHVICDNCHGKRYNEETLEIYYRGKNIYDILEMSIDEALEFFIHHPKIKRIFKTLCGVGLGYLKLGQSSTTLSGGEAQRVKLASELRKIDTGNTVYILDEPTTGLHFTDIQKLLETLQELVNKGNTVIVIEHNLDVIKSADYIIDLGPEGGEGGGKIVGIGTPEDIIEIKDSETGKVLKSVLSKKYLTKKSSSKPFKPKLKKERLIIKGAYENNLKHIDIDFPKNELIVITGKSGSGKSSLAMSTIFKEGQARFVESLSTYARQFLGKNEKAKVKSIQGLAPSIAVDQKNVTKNPRSIVATTTEIYDHLRVLYARAGDHHCSVCKNKLSPYPATNVYNDLIKIQNNNKGYLVAPLYLTGVKKNFKLLKPGHLKGLAEELIRSGFKRVIIDNKVFELGTKLPQLGYAKNIYLVIDRLVISNKNKKRITEAIETAYIEGNQIFVFIPHDFKCPNMYSQLSACLADNFFVPKEINPRHFSFNSHWGACDKCHGLGVRQSIAEELIIVDIERPFLDGGLDTYLQQMFSRNGTYNKSYFAAFCKANKILEKTCYKNLSITLKKSLLFGNKKLLYFSRVKKSFGGQREISNEHYWEGLIPIIERWYQYSESESARNKCEKLMKVKICPTCSGSRLSSFASNVRFGGLSLNEFCEKNVEDLIIFLKDIKVSKFQKIISEQILLEIKERVMFLKNVGLGYLELNRSSSSLSGGESQRIRLATQLGNKLQGVIYVLDEPTIGLHQVDTKRLIKTLLEMRDNGNTVIVVEHDEEVMNAADKILDLGPHAGEFGGEITFFGTPKKIKTSKDSLTGKYLSGKLRVPLPEKYRTPVKYFELKGVKTNNLQNVDVKIPLNCLTVVTGVSGSGKSSLVIETLPIALGLRDKEPGSNISYKSIVGSKAFEDIEYINQSPIGATPSSTPATFTGVFDVIRDVFANSKAAKLRGFKKGRFSFNTGEGRCSVCEGKGSVLIQMHFLADVWIKCEHCKGKRFNIETLAILHHQKNIADILNMTVGQALIFFESYPKIVRKLKGLVDVGLDYLKMGQSSTTLSGGEAQRMKLASQLSKFKKGTTLYILDEPTTGQHFDDISKLISIFHRLVDEGHSVIVVEHNLDVIKNADYVIDIGPGGGVNGGKILFQGSLSKLLKKKNNSTADYIVQKLI